MQRTENINIRCNVRLKEIISDAATSKNMTTTNFLIHAAMLQIEGYIGCISGTKSLKDLAKLPISIFNIVDGKVEYEGEIVEHFFLNNTFYAFKKNKS